MRCGGCGDGDGELASGLGFGDELDAVAWEAGGVTVECWGPPAHDASATITRAQLAAATARLGQRCLAVLMKPGRLKSQKARSMQHEEQPLSRAPA
jgi:hypothetical protein